MSITLTPHDEFLVVSAVRYARGSATYIVSMTVRWVMEHWEELTPNTRFVLSRDVAHEVYLRRVEGKKQNALEQVDQPEWEKLLDFIEAQPEGTPEHDGLKAGGAQW